MPTDLPALSLAGAPDVLAGLRAALEAAGYRLDAPGSRIWIHAGPAESLAPSAIGPGLLLAPAIGAAELQLLAAGNADVLLDSAPAAEVVARLAALRRRIEIEDGLRSDQELLGHLSDGVAVVDGAGVILMANSAGAALLGWSAATDGVKLLDLAVPLDAVSAAHLAQAISHRAPLHNVDVQVRLHDGRVAVLAISSGHLRRAEGRTILSLREVTGQRAVEDELRRTRDFLEHLIDGSSDAIAASDMRGRLVVFNRAAERLFGITAREALAKGNIIDLYAEGGAREMMRLLREAPSGHIEAVRSFGCTRTGELVPIEVSASVIRMNGVEVATVGLLRDLRERVRVESELARTRARLAEAEKQAAIAALAGATAHELNQPLTVVLGYVELLRRKVEPGQHRALDAIAQQAGRMAEIVKQIAQLTHLELQPYPGERQIADIERSVERRSTERRTAGSTERR